MKHLILKAAVMILTLAFGVGLDRVISVDRGPQSQNVQPVTQKIDEPHQELTAPPVPYDPDAPLPAPVPTLIFDYDPEKFYPEGVYYLMDPKPKEFADFEFFELGVTAIVEGQPSGYVSIQANPNNNYDFQTALFALVTERRVVFVTSLLSEEGFEYRFDGEFLRRDFDAAAGKNKAVLRGTLTKTKLGRKIAERVVSFRVEQHVC